jgi:hypothetical protein
MALVKGKDLQKSVIDMAHLYHWSVAHFPAVETKHRGWTTAVAADAKGFPDLLLVRERIVAIEIKGDGDRLSDAQRNWGERMNRANAEYYVIRPKDWPDKVKEVLT